MLLSLYVTFNELPSDSHDVDADTPRDRRDGVTLPRYTDHARLLLRRAQYALALMAVPVALTVGMIAAEPGTVELTPAVSQIMADAGSPWMSGRPVGPDAVSALARAEAVAHRVDASATPDPRDRREAGLFVLVVTLVLCWSMLLVAGAIWRHRLAVCDDRDWADGWARVEPRWSDRTV